MLGVIWEDKAPERTQSTQCSIRGIKNNIDQKRSEKEKITWASAIKEGIRRR